MPRLSPLARADMDERQTELIAGVAMPGAEAMNIFATLVRHGRLFRHWLPFGGVLLSGALPPREREILILRTAVRCDAPYEWTQHVRIGREAGLTDDEIERIREGSGAGEWAPFDAVLLRAADELHETSTLSDETFAALAERYDEDQLIEVPMLVGHYHMVAYALNALGIEVERDA